MRFAQLQNVPRHLLAATIERGRDRVPVRVKQIAADHLVIGPAPLALRERARLTLHCPLLEKSCEVEFEAVRKNVDSIWLSPVPM